MADSVFNYEIERFISPIRGLYKEYVISVEDLRAKSPELFENMIVDTASVRDGHLIYELYGDEEDGEIVKEHVQTWICDHRQEVTRAVGITLRTKETSFGSWFRASEASRSPDELFVYCLSKMYSKHTVILNKSFPWSTLSNYIKYSDLEIVQKSSIVLIYVGINQYAVLKPSWAVKPAAEITPAPTPAKTPRKNRRKESTTKTTCRTTGKRVRKESASSSESSSVCRKQPARRTRTLAERRFNQFGIGGGDSGSTITTRKKQVDYVKLNDGFPEDEATSPKPKRKRTYLPSRSGPSSTRQKAQTTITSPPARVLPCVPAKKTASQPKNSPNATDVQKLSPLSQAPSGVQNTPASDTTLPILTSQPTDDAISGVQSTISGVQPSISVDRTSSIHPEMEEHTLAPIAQDIETRTQCEPVPDSTNSAQIVPPTTDDKLPDLVRPSKPETDNFSPILDAVPPVGEEPPDNIFDGGTTEEEFDAVDALLSLSTIREESTENMLDDNASLMPIGGNNRYQDINPVAVRLDQVSVDGAIAQIVQEETLDANIPAVSSEIDGIDHRTPDKAPLSGVQSTLSGVQNALSGVQDTKEHETIATEPEISLNPSKPSPQTAQSGVQLTSSGVQTTSTDVEHVDINSKDECSNQEKVKGYVKVTTHGIKKNTNTSGRIYRCRICGVRKRSAHNLNDHHKRRHSAEMCGVCGKLFDLASSLKQHMYTHDERRFFCENCSFHCHFESELRKHNISHHSYPSHQCMKRNCGRWFKRKADLVLHVETHNDDVLECDKCDYSTTIQKYLKEHKKCHENVLPYSCNICGKRFLWRSGVRAHKAKEHTEPK